MITYHELSHVLCCCLKLYFLKLFLFWFFEFFELFELFSILFLIIFLWLFFILFFFQGGWKHARRIYPKKSRPREFRSKTNIFKSKFACILEASESTRMRVEGNSTEKIMDHIAGKGDNSLQHYNLIHIFIPMPQAMKIPAAKKQPVDKEWKKLEKIPAWDLTKVRNKSEVIDEARTKGIQVHFSSLMDTCHLKIAELETKHQKTKVESYSEVILWKTIRCLMQYSPNKGHQHHKWQQQKLWISSPDCQGAQDKQLMQYLLKPRWKLEDAPKLLKIPKS